MDGQLPAAYDTYVIIYHDTHYHKYSLRMRRCLWTGSLWAAYSIFVIMYYNIRIMTNIKYNAQVLMDGQLMGGL